MRYDAHEITERSELRGKREWWKSEQAFHRDDFNSACLHTVEQGTTHGAQLDDMSRDVGM